MGGSGRSPGFRAHAAPPGGGGRGRRVAVLAGQGIEMLDGAVGDKLGVASHLEVAVGLSGSTTGRLTLGLASRLRPFYCSRVVLTPAQSPSKSTHTSVDCGWPPAPMVLNTP